MILVLWLALFAADSRLTVSVGSDRADIVISDSDASPIKQFAQYIIRTGAYRKSATGLECYGYESLPRCAGAQVCVSGWQKYNLDAPCIPLADVTR